MSKKESKKFYQLKCVLCNSEFDEKVTCTTCLKCGGPLDAEYDYDRIKKRLNTFSLKYAPISAEKYLDFYPIHDLNKLVSLKEGGTPLHHVKNLGKKFGLNQLYVKHEGMNPTGVFKDRGSFIEVSKAVEMGAKAICLASSGNMAASVSAYAAKVKIPCYILVPEGTPIGKLAQIISNGGRVLQVRTDYSHCAKLVVDIAKKHNFYLAGDYVFRREGQKSTAYEIVEQLNWQAPDYVICPVAVGTNFAGIAKGFEEFHKLGFIDKMPKMIAVQAAGCAPIEKAFREKKKKAEHWDKIDTICSAITISDPVDSPLVLDYVYKTNGAVFKSEDSDTLEAQQELCHEEAIFVEPSSAVAISVLPKIIKELKIKPDEKVVYIATGNGLKDPVTIIKTLPSPPSIEPRLEEVDNYLKMKLYNIKSTVEKDKVDVLFKKMPDKKTLEETIKEVFKITLTKKYINELSELVKSFFKKGKPMVKSDLQHMIEDILKTMPDDEKIIRVEDFRVKTSKNSMAEAEVDLCIHNGKIKTEKAEGVGPVDAIIKAARKVIEKEAMMNYSLTTYDVKIDQKGTDATVEVSMGLKDNEDNKVISTATSPDIIVASIEAFERAYNILWNKRKEK